VELAAYPATISRQASGITVHSIYAVIAQTKVQQ